MRFFARNIFLLEVRVHSCLPVFTKQREFLEIGDIVAFYYASKFRSQAPMSIISLLFDRLWTVQLVV